jgi:hypothetical protein
MLPSSAAGARRMTPEPAISALAPWCAAVSAARWLHYPVGFGAVGSPALVARIVMVR